MRNIGLKGLLLQKGKITALIVARQDIRFAHALVFDALFVMKGDIRQRIA
jgi:hypothetical protein